MTITDAVLRADEVPSDLLGELPDSSHLLGEPDGLRARFESDGFIFLRGALDDDEVLAARAEVLARLFEFDEIEPDTDGIFTGRSRRPGDEASRGELWRDVSNGAALRRVTHGERIASIVKTLVGRDVTPLDYLMLRVGVNGRATEAHMDAPFFTRDHDQMVTVWTPLGSTPVSYGPLYVIGGSHRFDDELATASGFDVGVDVGRRAAFDESGVDIARRHDTQLLTADFEPGDVLMFGMFTIHGSFEHHDSANRVRVSTDARWQPSDLPFDERYMEPDITGTTGLGYAELNGSKPLTESWHVR